jgi:hypothetical protein
MVSGFSYFLPVTMMTVGGVLSSHRFANEGTEVQSGSAACLQPSTWGTASRGG